MRRVVTAIVLGALAPLLVAASAHGTTPTECAQRGAAECDVAYGPGGFAGHQSLDVYYASKTAATLRPAVVLVHGGGWWAGDKVGMAGAGRGVRNMGWVAFSIDYRLADDPNVAGPGDTAAPYVDQPADVAAAVRWVRNNAAAYSVDPNRIAIMGGSAGAHLALLHGVRHDAPSDPLRVKAVVSWAGPTHFAAMETTHPCVMQNGRCAPLEQLPPDGITSPPTLAGVPEQIPVADMMRVFAGGCTYTECKARYDSTSPASHVSATTPPTFFAHGVADAAVPYAQSELMIVALTANRVPTETYTCTTVTLRDASGMSWPYPCNHWVLAIDPQTWPRTEAFLRKHV